MIGKLFIISAPCGAGKSSLLTVVLEELREWQLEQVITYTTRKPRVNECHGQDYYFIDTHDFERHLQEGFFLEWSNAYGAYYGSPFSIVPAMEKGKSFLLIVDRAGARQIIKKVPQAVLIWITVSSIAQLQERLVRRATETPAQIEKRLAQSHREIMEEQRDPLYHHIIVNDDFGTAKLQLMAIIIQELKVGRMSLGMPHKHSQGL